MVSEQQFSLQLPQWFQTAGPKVKMSLAKAQCSEPQITRQTQL